MIVWPTILYRLLLINFEPSFACTCLALELFSVRIVVVVVTINNVGANKTNNYGMIHNNSAVVTR